MWTKAAWLEAEREEEGTVPSCWVDQQQRLVFWPPGNDVARKMRERTAPNDQWMKFPLIKCKFASGMSLTTI